MINFTVQSKVMLSIKITLLQPHYQIVYTPVTKNESALKGPVWLDKNDHAPTWVTNHIVFNNNHSAELMFTWSPTSDGERNEA